MVVRPIYDYFLSQNRLKELNDLLKTTIDILNNNNIMYFADGGTLLGAIRHKGQIPWDDDADISCDIKDYHKLIKLESHFNEKGYKLNVNNKQHILKVYVENGWLLGEDEDFKRLVGTPTLDIFFVRKNNVGIYSYSDLNLRKKWSSCYHHESNLFPLTEVIFNDFKIMIPKNPYPYLDRYYKDWSKKIIIDERKINDPLDKNSVVEFKIKSLNPFIVTEFD